MIWDEKWLNATVTLPKIEEQMKSRMYQIGTDVVTISKLPEFKFEAMEVYRKTLDMNQAIQEGQRLADIQKRKLEAERMEAERKAREAEEAAKQQTAAEQKEEPADGEGSSIRICTGSSGRGNSFNSGRGRTGIPA